MKSDKINIQYLKWKNWSNARENFGSLTVANSKYFTRQFEVAGVKIKKELRVLEIGFGNGSLLQYLKEVGCKVTGTELNCILVEKGLESGFNVICTDSLDCFKADSFDLVLAFDVLEHISDERILDLFTSIKRVINNDGLFFARFPNGDSPLGLPYQNGDVTHVNAIGSGKIIFYSQYIKAQIIYLGGEYIPVFQGLNLYSIHRIITMPIIFILNLTLKFIFFPRSKVSLTAKNLVFSLKIRK
jgi:2-polyprenyl-3-methyl-5-hydroxy-6-metoxy-1,4-benzoquinol methylase